MRPNLVSRRFLLRLLATLTLALTAWSITPPAFAGEKAPEFTLKDMNRKSVSLSDYRGKVVLITFWATWCTPCLREIPDLLALEAELPASDFRLLAISMDDAYSEGWVTEFKAKHFPTLVSFINAELDMDTLVSVIDPVWNETLPTSYIFNRDGEVVKKVQGKKPIAFFREQLVAAGL